MDSASMVRRAKQKWASVMLMSTVANCSTAESQHKNASWPVGFWGIFHTNPQRLQFPHRGKLFTEGLPPSMASGCPKVNIFALGQTKRAPIYPKSSWSSVGRVPLESPGYHPLSPQLSWTHWLPIRTSLHLREQVGNLCPSAQATFFSWTPSSYSFLSIVARGATQSLVNLH